MAARSPSPNPTRSLNPNLNTRTPEPNSNNGIRRSSGSFSLSKPSISAEIPQRNLGSKRDILPCLRASFEQKENSERARSGPRTPRGRSSSKGPKNFMAPTISASSKVISASPAKKILGERNEVISVSRSLELPSTRVPGSRSGTLFPSEGGEIEDVGSKSETGFSDEESFDPKFGSKSETGFLGYQEIFDPKIKNQEYVDLPSSSPSPTIASLDADPSLPPYDPMTNYLSPRPQFLRYKPNPRLEHYLEVEKGFLEVRDGNNLDDRYSSESFDDTSETTDEGQPSPLRQQEPEVEESSPSKVESSYIYETETDIKAVPKSDGGRVKHYYVRSKLVPSLLVLIIVCLSVPLSDCPLLSSSSTILKDYSSPTLFKDSYIKDYTALANLRIERIANSLKHLSISSLAYVSNLAPFVPRQQLGYSDLLLANWTLSINEKESFELEVADVIKEDEEKYKPDEMISDVSDDFNEDDSNSEVETLVMEVIEDFEEGDKKSEVEILVMEFPEDEPTIHFDAMEEEMEKDHPSHEITASDIDGSSEEPYHDTIEEDHPVTEEMENELEKTELGMIESTTVGNQDKDISVDSVFQNQEEISLDSSEEHHQISTTLKLQEARETGISLEDVKASIRDIWVICSALVLLITISSFLYSKKKPVSEAHERLQTISKEAASVSGSSESYGHHRMMGDSSPTEVGHGSFIGDQRPKSGKEEEEAMSSERRLRRESGVSSSISYGSFTTYERLSGKKGVRDQGSVTPVRRSSRIRNQVTSPS